MTDDEKLKNAFIFGEEAKKVVNNKAYQFAMTAIKGHIFDKLANTKILSDNGDNKYVIELARELQSINALETKLEKIMSDGHFAEKHIADKQKTQNRHKR